MTSWEIPTFQKIVFISNFVGEGQTSFLNALETTVCFPLFIFLGKPYRRNEKAFDSF